METIDRKGFFIQTLMFCFDMDIEPAEDIYEMFKPLVNTFVDKTSDVIDLMENIIND
jgi:hypothetical protein